jgi:hypothetical protein
MNKLKTSMGDELFPFRWAVDDNERASDIELTNAFMQLEADMGEYRKRDYPFLSDKSLDHKFGPPCTIGLEFEAAQDFTLPPREYDDIDLDAVRQPFLWSGQCARGTRFRIRMSHPTSAGYDSVVPGFYHLVELQLSKELTIRFFTSNQRSDRYTVECSAAFLPGFDAAPESRAIQIAECSRDLKDVYPTDGVVDDADATAIVAIAARRTRELLKEVLAGYFYISAIRQPHLYSHLDEATFDENLDLQSLIDARHVGPPGEATWRLERKFAYNPMELVLDPKPTDRAEYNHTLEEYTSKWMRTLLQTGINYSEAEYPSWQKSPLGESPTGFLIDSQPLVDEERREFERGLVEEGSLLRLKHSCFGNEPQLPKQMSSGFHQLMPLIVQTGLMRQYEIMAVENPEVHLHPRLQLDVAEFLMRQAKSGKWIIIETHSDLIIRRVIREIQDEQIAIGQSKIGIYFANIDESEEGYHYSTITRLRLNADNRVEWPAGFLGDDLREGRKLFNAMYGLVPEEGIDDEESDEP